MGRSFWAWILVFISAVQSVPAAGLAGSRVKYVGGTAALPVESGGALDTTGEDQLRFVTRSGAVEIPYSQINLVEYGQKVDRRIILAIVLSPLFLLTKSRRHYLTVGYASADGRQQALVFQVGKSDIRAVLSSLEARTGRRVTYQDEDARKAGRG